MNTIFDKYLHEIDENIRIQPQDSVIYESDFEEVRENVLQILCQESDDFKQIFKGSTLFGSYANDVRIHCADEFDVHIHLEFSKNIYPKLIADKHRPGYVHLNVDDIITNYDHGNVNELLDQTLAANMDAKLDRCHLQRWLHYIFLNAFGRYRRRVRGRYGDIYELSYQWRGITFTITAKSEEQTFKIDFVPAICVKYKGNASWRAIPKGAAGPKQTQSYTFLLSNTSMELQLLDGRQNLRPVFRLLSALFAAKGLPKLRNYFITTAFLWELQTMDDDFWNAPLSIILMHMLGELCDYFERRFLPYYWNSNMNLLVGFQPNELERYRSELAKAFNTLQSYRHQPNLSFSRCIRHFGAD